MSAESRGGDDVTGATVHGRVSSSVQTERTRRFGPDLAEPAQPEYPRYSPEKLARCRDRFGALRAVDLRPLRLACRRLAAGIYYLPVNPERPRNKQQYLRCRRSCLISPPRLHGRQAAAGGRRGFIHFFARSQAAPGPGPAARHATVLVQVKKELDSTRTRILRSGPS